MATVDVAVPPDVPPERAWELAQSCSARVLKGEIQKSVENLAAMA